MNSRRFMSGMGDFLVWGFVCQGVRQTASFFLCFFVRAESPFLYLDQRFAHVGAHRIVAPTLWHASPLPGYTLTAPSTTARLVRSGDDQRGARFRGAINRATTLYPVGPGPEPRCSHAHRQRSSEPADPFSPSAYESQGSTSGPRHRHRQPSQADGLDRNCRVPLASSVQCAGRRTTPSGTTPSRTNRHRAIRSLRAKATIMSLRAPRAFSVRARNHCAKVLSFWNMRNRHANWIMPRRTRALPERASPFSQRFLPLSSGEPVRPA